MDPATVDPRRGHRHRAGSGQHLTLAVVAIAHHQTPSILIELISELLHIGGDLSLQSRREHLPHAVASDLIKQRSTPSSVLNGRLRILNYGEHGRTFPNQRTNAGS
jgi:hypothetical protein